jgi:hypothetical protein
MGFILMMMCYNEAAVIERALRSALPHVDMCVIVDHESTDETVNIAVKVCMEMKKISMIQRLPWCKHFGMARNQAMVIAEALIEKHGEQGSHWWGIFLDADNTIEGALITDRTTLEWWNEAAACGVGGISVPVCHTNADGSLEPPNNRIHCFNMTGYRWRYLGAAHETAACAGKRRPGQWMDRTTVECVQKLVIYGPENIDFVFRSWPDGKSYEDKRKKYETDITFLLADMKDICHDMDGQSRLAMLQRSEYFLGVSREMLAETEVEENLRLAGRGEALLNYVLCLEMGGSEQERYLACCGAVRCYKGYSNATSARKMILGLIQRSQQLSPKRVECAWHALRIYKAAEYEEDLLKKMVRLLLSMRKTMEFSSDYILAVPWLYNHDDEGFGAAVDIWIDHDARAAQFRAWLEPIEAREGSANGIAGTTEIVAVEEDDEDVEPAKKRPRTDL